MTSRGRLLVEMVGKNDKENLSTKKDFHNDHGKQHIPLNDCANNLKTSKSSIFTLQSTNSSNIVKEPSVSKTCSMPTTEYRNVESRSPLPSTSSETPTENTFKANNEKICEDIDLPIPSTSNTANTGHKQINYYISPIRSDESDVDDSDADPHFDSSKNKIHSSKKYAPVTSSSTSSDSSSSSSSSSSESTHSDPVDIQNNAAVNDNGEEERKKGKKRIRRPENWKTNTTKKLRNSGKAYVSMSKSKKQVPAKRVRPPCGEKCRLNCSTKIDETTRQLIFHYYWSLADLQRQREFIIKHTQEIKPKYRYSSTQNLRALNTAFYFDVADSHIRVCKYFFKATLDLNDRPIKTALSKKSNFGYINGELRGKHGNHPTISQEIREGVVNFINSIPRVESHYLRAQTTREYIQSDKSLADLYRDYKEICETNNMPFASMSTFNRIFNTEFNISFYIPKKDMCDLCESYKNANEDEKQKLFESYQEHIMEKQLARIEKENDKNRNDVKVAVYDLQAVMQVPKGQVSLFYYKSRINCFNFTVSDLKAKNVQCFFWDETEGKRGAVEIGSCILIYIENLLAQNPDADIDIIFYSDNCGGQQKNKYLLAVYAFAVFKMRVKSITHKFLIRGHTQNEGDNVHSIIEKQIKRYFRSGPIYTPQEYLTLIRTAKKTGHPYKVLEMTHEKFYNIKALQEEWGNNFNVDENKNQVKWHDIKILRVEKESPGAFLYKTSYADINFKKTFVRKQRTRANTEVFSIGLTQAYSMKLPLSEAKKKDIKELIDKNVIPKTHYENYYKHKIV